MSEETGEPRPQMPRLWIALMVILVACLIASMVIAIVKLN